MYFIDKTDKQVVKVICRSIHRPKKVARSKPITHEVVVYECQRDKKIYSEPSSTFYEIYDMIEGVENET